ncbi:MAG TPA: hypothetical protein VD886_20005 [Herpetosiphonaceae bacterium]|nr:hypothetical protein [Herpetosiphonaceae bacterium]
MKIPNDPQLPPVIAAAPARPAAGDYRVPHANTGWEPAGSSISRGFIAIVGCLGLALLVITLLCIIAWVIIHLAS